MKIKAKLKDKIVYIVQIIFDELRMIPMCICIEQDGTELLYIPFCDLQIDDKEY